MDRLAITAVQRCRFMSFSGAGACARTPRMHRFLTGHIPGRQRGRSRNGWAWLLRAACEKSWGWHSAVMLLPRCAHNYIVRMLKRADNCRLCFAICSANLPAAIPRFRQIVDSVHTALGSNEGQYANVHDARNAVARLGIADMSRGLCGACVDMIDTVHVEQKEANIVSCHLSLGQSLVFGRLFPMED